MKNLRIIVALLGALILQACGGGGTSGGSGPTNTPPVANAGPNQSVSTGTTVSLDGSGSSDANGDVLSYSWSLTSKPSGSNANLSGSTSSKPTFVADLGGNYVVTLVVNDGKANSSPSTVTISANTAPVARAGSAQVVLPGVTVNLDGSASSDAENDPLAYSWAFSSKPSASKAALSATTVAKPTFVADVSGSYVVALTVNDGKASSLPTSVTITANTPPIAKAGSAQSVLTGAVVSLDGSGSTDADGDALSYAWTITTRPTGSNASLSATNVARPTFTADVGGVYVATLVVGDGIANSAPSTVAINANTAPVARAGSAQSVSTGDKVTLDGSGSTDAENDSLTYLWAITSKPTGSSAALSSTTVAKPTFTADLGGSYVATLVVNDGKLNSAPSTVTITANTAPVANAGAAQTVLSGATVSLDGTGSTDAENDPLTYSWTLTSKPSGSSAVLSGSTTSRPSFVADMAGAYTATLVVNDGKQNSSPASVTITANQAFALTVTAQYQKPAPLSSNSLHIFTEAASPVTAPIPYVWIELQRANGTYVAGTYADINGQAKFTGLDSTVTYVPAIRSKALGPGNFDLWVVNNTNPQDTSATTLRKRYAPYTLLGSSFTPSKSSSDQSVSLTAQIGWDATKNTFDDTKRDSAPFSAMSLVLNAYAAYYSAMTTQTALPQLTILWSTINIGGSSDSKLHIDQGISISNSSYYTSGYYSISSNGDSSSGNYISESYIWLMGSQNTIFREFTAMTISHEFTHFIHNQWIRNYTMGGSHAVGEYQDPSLAFHEGFADGMAMLINNSAIRMSPYPNAGKIYVYGEDYSSSSTINPKGWFHEMSIANFLWDLGRSSGSFKLSVPEILGPPLSTSWSTGAWVPNIWAYGKILKSLYPAKSSAIDTLGASYNITLSGNDELGSNEAVLGNRTIIDSFPIHTVIPIGGSGTQVCSVGGQNEYNKLGNRRYLKFLGDGASHSISITGPSGSSPIFYLNTAGIWSKPGYNSYTTSEKNLIPATGLWGYIGDCSVIKSSNSADTTACIPTGQTFSSEQCWTIKVLP